MLILDEPTTGLDPVTRMDIIASGSADQLKDRLGRDVIEVRVADASGFGPAADALAPLLSGSSGLDRDRQRLTMPAPGGAATLSAALGYLADAGVTVADIGIRRPSLDEVFVALTGGYTPQLLVVSAVPPVLFVVLFRYVFGGAIHTPGHNYADYLLPTILILTQLLGTTTAVALATDLAGGMVERFRSLPIARSAMLAGRTIADLGRAVLVAAVGIAAGVAVGFRFHTGFLPSLAGVGLVLAFSTSKIAGHRP